MKTKVNYLNNKDLLEEIHKSKNGLGQFVGLTVGPIHPTWIRSKFDV